MRAESYYRLQHKEEVLSKIRAQMSMVKRDVDEALKNDEQEKAMTLYVKHFRLTNEYFIVKQEVENLRLICK